MLRPYIADIITLTRIIGSIDLLSTNVFSNEFFLIYTYCGISDALDGFVARKLKTESKLGSVLDSISDWIFYSMMFIKIWSALVKALPGFFFTVIWTIFGIRVSCYAYVFAKEKKFASEHFILNKVTGLLLFVIPYIINKSFFVYYAALVCLVAFIAAIYEYRFHLTGKK